MSSTLLVEKPSDPRTLTTPTPAGILATVIMVSFVTAGVWAVAELKINAATLIRSWENAVRFFRNVMPLDFPSLAELWEMTALTLAIVVSATILAVVLSLVAALLAAKPTSTSPAVRSAARFFIVLMRAAPELILAIFFIRVFGFGSMAGILALGLSSIGMVGKLYADAIEDADDGPREAVETNGAGRIQQIFGATIPTVMPAIVATGLHRFDINLRNSVILGWVGVGGIGMELSTALSVRQYDRGLALAFVVLALCILTEIVSGMWRSRLLGRKAEPSRFGVLWLFGKMKGRWSQENLGAPEPTRTTPPWDAARLGQTFFTGLLLAIIVVSLWYSDINWGRFFEGFVRLPEVTGRFLPPSHGGHLVLLLEQLLITFQIALAGTLLGAVLALPVGVLAARNVAPNPTTAKAFRTIIVVTRGIPELILAIVFVIVTGMGPVAGALALAVGAMGLLSKLVADSLEETDTRVQMALRANGATEWQVFFGATLRQVAPAVIAHLIYQLDVNFRSATLLGVVGAGGIGFYLLNANRVLQFEVVTFILVLVVAVVLALEAIAVLLRNIVR
ncbi:phosphonate ABC transporter, permease protein PhnE [Corynebacterium sp.]|uniref:phosphonate ABC transporter, permease protein PhnE n=1 Tax=Corynebacterium sp. TaxID=1720 RepID=UPI0026DEF16D|nr:phosphonate ABC transporter, permease protein PhnE [Corynebacterium sp.]MDO5513017.1 phosphonate ABC transporter, permease protein PhnE [Corynebacterium sp.]